MEAAVAADDDDNDEGVDDDDEAAFEFPLPEGKFRAGFLPR